MKSVKFCKEGNGYVFMKKRYLAIISFLILGSFCWLNCRINNENTEDIIGIYIEGEYFTSVPHKDSDYYVEKIECDNGSSGEWDYVNWGLLTTNMSKKSKCNVYFRKDTIVEAIKNELDTTGKCPSVNADGSVNVTSAESENSLLCSAPDNYGTSYYYRGNVTNNYVYFAGFYWRIVRINGDGSIRMIYDGTKAHENGEASADRIAGKSAFNVNDDDNAYGGYMYGTPGSSTYEETHANINDSTIKKYVDGWYEENILKYGKEKSLIDNIFCNDRSLSSNVPNNYNNLGYGTNPTAYRWYYGPWSLENYNSKVNLLCSRLNDAFSVNNFAGGNGFLVYPIGLLSADEMVLAGGWSINNNGYYLYTGLWWWGLSPYYYNGAITDIRFVDPNGNVFSEYGSVKGVGGVKPVINLKQGALKTGNGTITNAYLVD